MEHTDDGKGIGDGAVFVVDRRGDGAEARMVLIVVHGVALPADALQLRLQLLIASLGVGRIGLHAVLAKDALHLCPRHVRQHNLALYRAVYRQLRARSGHHAEGTCRFDQREHQRLAAGQERQADRFVGLLPYCLHVGLGDKDNVPHISCRAAQLKQMQAECIASIRQLFHQVRFSERCQQTVRRALDQTCFCRKLMQGERPPRVVHCLQQLDRPL